MSILFLLFIYSYSSCVQIMIRNLIHISELIGFHGRRSVIRPIIQRNTFSGAGAFSYTAAHYNVMNLSTNMSASMVRATVRAVSKRKLLPTRAALTLVSYSR